MRKEFKIGGCIFILFGLINVFFQNVPDFIPGFLGILSLSLIIVGTLREDVYEKLKMRKGFLKR